MHEALAGLDAGDQEILRLVAWDGLAPARAGMVLGCSPGAARSGAGGGDPDDEALDAWPAS